MPSLILLTVTHAPDPADTAAQLEVQRPQRRPIYVDFPAADVALARAVVDDLARAYPDAFTMIDEV